MTLSVLAVVVLYDREPHQSPALDALRARSRHDPGLRVVVWNNGPEALDVPLPEACEFEQRLDNPGLPVAYNHGLQRASALGCEWLLLLDQDTELDDTYWHAAEHALATAPEIDLWAPSLRTPKGTLVSPCRFWLQGGIPTRDLPGARLPLSRWAFLNSALLGRTALLQQVGGWPESVFLDGADFALRHRLLAHDPTLGVLPVTLLHHFHAEEAPTRAADFARHARYLRSNAAFAREARSPWPQVWALAHSLRLSLRHRSTGPLAAWLSQQRGPRASR